MRCSVILSLAAALCLVTAPAAERAPNIVLILADDLGLGPVGAYGNPYAATPVLDQLARDGLRFSTAYAAAPVCSPTRGAIMTGKLPARTHLTDFISGSPFTYARLQQPKWKKVLPLTEHTLPEILSERGYATALFGKWHLAKGYTPPQSVAEGPDRQGFAETFITHKPEQDSNPEADAHGVQAITKRALDFIDRRKDQSFFLLLTPNTIHSPVMAPAALVAKHRQRPGADRPENNATIAAMMEQLDDAIGTVLAKLDSLGLAQNTLVIFASDNGGLLRDASQSPLRGGKAQLYEGGLRVPLLMRWPGTIAAGRVTDVQTSSVDLFATLLAVASAKDLPPETRDGLSLLDVMRSDKATAVRPLIWHYPHYHNSGIHGPASAVRLGDWKYIYYYEFELTGEGPPSELFNLRTDPAETTNLARAEPARVQQLRTALLAQLTSAGAQFPQLNPNFDPTRAQHSTR